MLFKNNFGKILTATGLCLTMASAPVIINSTINNSGKTSKAIQINNVDSLIPNKDFSQYSSSETPYSPSSWTRINPNNVSSSNLKSGVIKTTDSAFNSNKKDYGLNEEENPKYPNVSNIPTNESDPLFYSLMMNNTSNAPERFGYESNTFTLKADSYYSFHFYVKTLKTKNAVKENVQASVYLTGVSDPNMNIRMEHIQTPNSNFIEYTMFVATHALQDEEVKLQLWLGGKENNIKSFGAVFFNKVNLKQYDEQSFYSTIEKANIKNTVNTGTITKCQSYYNLNSGEVNYSPVDNANFQDTSSTEQIPGWEVTSGSSTNTNVSVLNLTSAPTLYPYPEDDSFSITNPQSSMKFNNALNQTEKVLFMHNKKEAEQTIKSSSLTVLPHALYKLSIMAKSNCKIGDGATIKLVSDNTEAIKDFKPFEASLQVATTESESVYTNNWTEYSFYIEGNALSSINAHLEISLGTKEKPTEGWVFIDSIKLSHINRKQFNAESSSTSAPFDLNKGSKNNESVLINNGTFNIANNETSKVTYPLNPANWSFVDKSSNHNKDAYFNGIIKTDEEFFNNEEITKDFPTDIKNPGTSPDSLYQNKNNVLVVGSTQIADIAYNSDNATLSENSYYRLTFNIKTQINTFANSEYNKGANFKLVSNNTTLFEHSNINTNEWQKYTFYIKTSNSSQQVSLQLGINNTSGYAFFDNVELVKTTLTEDAFNNKISNRTSFEQAVDLSKDSFDFYDASSNLEIINPTTWELSTIDGQAPNKSGIYNNAAPISGSIATNLPIQPKSGNNLLFIQSGLDTYSYYTSKQSYTLSSGKYYSFEVSIKTKDLFTRNEKAENFGAYFGLKNIEQKFVNINSEKEYAEDYTTYTYYISPTSDVTTNVILGLGNSETLCSGLVAFDDVIFKELEESVYKNLTSSLDGTEKNIINITKTEEKTEEEKENPFVANQINWLILPSVLLSLAVIIAIVGFYLRKINFKKHLKIKTKYDRRITLDKEMDRREQIELRKQIIAELEKELNEVDNELKTTISKYDEEENKIKQANKEYIDSVIATQKQLAKDKEEVIKKHKELVENAGATDKTDKQEKEYIKTIAKIEKQEKIEEAKLNQKDKAMVKLQIRKKNDVEMFEEKRNKLLLEINNIEQEIKEIEKQVNIMWNEYSKAKTASKAKNKSIKNSNKKESLEKVDDNKLENNNSEESNDVEVLEENTSTPIDEEDENTVVVDEDSNK